MHIAKLKKQIHMNLTVWLEKQKYDHGRKTYKSSILHIHAVPSHVNIEYALLSLVLLRTDSFLRQK